MLIPVSKSIPAIPSNGVHPAEAPTKRPEKSLYRSYKAKANNVPKAVAAASR